MNYQESLEFIHGIERFGSKPGIRRVKMLLERIGNPHNKLRFIHVAGTNGKGSTCSMLNHILISAGYRTGLYISPFVVDFRERIQFNNEMISQEDLAEVTTYVKGFWDELESIGEPPTEFELVVAIAMEYFARKKCEIVVLEVGLGGRFDATNVIGAPLVSVITNISLDHTEILGTTVEEIAGEKCGIIKPGGVTVTYPKQNPVALAVIMKHCAEQGNRLFQPHGVEVLEETIEGSRFRYDGMEIFVPMAGKHQIYNAMTAIETCRALELTTIGVEKSHILDGISATQFPSRLEILHRNPLILLDGAHNSSGAQALSSALDLLKGKQIHAVIGLSADKDADSILSMILARCCSATLTRSTNFKAMPLDLLAPVAHRYCNDITLMEDDQEGAFLSALSHCGPDDVLLVCGSFYLAAELRSIILAHFDR